MDDFYQRLGGTPACRRLSKAFYNRVQRDLVLKPLFPGKTMKCAIEEFAAFLAQFLGGPAEDVQRRWWLSLQESHSRFRIGERERTAWMKNMVDALEEVEFDPGASRALREFFERSSAYMVDTAPLTQGDLGTPELAWRWTAQQTLDEAVAAICKGDAERVISLAEGPTLQAYFRSSPTVFPAVLATLIRKREAAMLAYVRKNLAASPALVQQRYSGRTLLHDAAAAGDLDTVELLLRLGAPPDTLDDGAHTPLYSVANECEAPGGAEVARTLIRNGADVEAAGGVKHCTALHMAARRGNLEIAGALLDCGAAIEARDSQRETPLRRAVNCNQAEVAALLLARGGDPHSRCKKGLTPHSAARSSAMKLLLAGYA